MVYKLKEFTCEVFEKCNYCNSAQNPMFVHGHYQCAQCKNNIYPCCQGSDNLD